MAALLRRGRSIVSVVVGLTDANAPFLEGCLASLAGQQRQPDEVLVAVSGTGADTKALLASALDGWPGAGDLRLVGGLVAEGLVRATGTFVMVLEAGDVLVPGAVGSLAGALDESGSDVAIPGTGTRVGASLQSAADAVAPVALASLMQRTAFAREVGLVVAPPPVAEWLPAVQALLRAATFDVVAGPVRRGPRRGTGLAFGALPDVAPHLRRVIPLVESVLAGLSSPALRPAREHFTHWLLSSEVAGYLADAERCDQETWDALSGLVGRLVTDHAAGPVDARVRTWLTTAGRRADLEAFNADRWQDGGDYPTRVQGSRVLAVLPVADVPDEVLEISAEESPLVTQLRRARWSDERHLEIELVAFTRLVGASSGPARLTLAAVSDAGARVELEVTAVGSPEVDLIAGERHHDHAEGLYRAEIDARSLAARGPGHWSLHVEWQRADVRRSGTLQDWEGRGSLAALAALAALPPRSFGDQLVRLDVPTARLVCEAGVAAVSDIPRSEITGLAVDGDVLVVTGRILDAGARPLRLRVRGNRGTCAVRIPADSDVFTVRLPLRHDPWGLGETPLPPGAYRVRLQGGQQGRARIVLGDQVAARTPYVERSRHFRLTVERNPDGTPHLVLGPPLADDEVGARAQHELQRWHVSDEHRLDSGAVYLQSYAGASATDSPLAIHRELRRTRPDLRLLWAVADSSVTVPDGAERLLLRSRAWYAAVSTCGHIVTNIEMPSWFRKRSGQRLLQTGHGYPAKSVGVREWESKNFPPSLVERQLRRSSGQWDLVLTPHPDLDVHFREQYRYDGAILSRGYPRDDDLLAPDAARRRADVRRRLGIGDRTAVLYAPTWRDDLTTGYRAALLASTFDVNAAAEALGPDHVILLRGHRFHRQRPDTGGGVIDVTGYPEVNDLILAADAGVLDYSSLRFDLALTERPMVFLVPDLARYEGDIRGFLYDFRSSAPGPLVETTAQVVEALRDLDRVAERYEVDYARFNQWFNAYQDGHSAERVVEAFFGPG